MTTVAPVAGSDGPNSITVAAIAGRAPALGLNRAWIEVALLVPLVFVLVVGGGIRP